MHAGAEVCIAKLAVEVRGIDPAALNKVCLKHDPRLHQALALEQPPRGTNYKNKSEGVTYATYFFGKDAFGIIDPEGGALEMIVHDKDEIGGPLNQFSTIGYKFETNGATILYQERMLRVMSVSTFSATDEAN